MSLSTKNYSLKTLIEKFGVPVPLHIHDINVYLYDPVQEKEIAFKILACANMFLRGPHFLEYLDKKFWVQSLLQFRKSVVDHKDHLSFERSAYIKQVAEGNGREYRIRLKNVRSLCCVETQPIPKGALVYKHYPDETYTYIPDKKKFAGVVKINEESFAHQMHQHVSVLFTAYQRRHPQMEACTIAEELSKLFVVEMKNIREQIEFTQFSKLWKEVSEDPEFWSFLENGVETTVCERVPGKDD